MQLQVAGELKNDLLALLLDQLEALKKLHGSSRLKPFFFSPHHVFCQAPIPQKVSDEIEHLRAELQTAEKKVPEEILTEQCAPKEEVARLLFAE